MTTIQPLRAARQSGEQQCPHRPLCPRALAHDRSGARIRASHPEQGWSLLCNGVVIFDDGGAPPQKEASASPRWMTRRDSPIERALEASLQVMVLEGPWES